MRCFRKDQWTIALWLVSFTMAVSGCHNEPKRCNDIPPGAIPQPNGTHVCQWNHAETARADQDNFVVYQYEWSADGTKLTQFGQEHLARIAQGLPQVCFPVVIEPVSDQRLNEIRRMAVLEWLANCHVPIAPERVVLARPEAEGLYGQEATAVSSGMLGNQGGGGGAGGTTGGATGGGATTTGGGMGVY